MRRWYNLRFRVALAFAGCAAIVGVLMAMALFLATHDLGQRLIDETLTAELDDFFARRERNAHSLPPRTVTLHGYVQEGSQGEEIPVYLQRLSPGRHDVNLGTLSYRVLVADRQQARYFFLYDTTLQNRREKQFPLLLSGSILAVMLVSALGGYWLVGLVIAPVIELATRVRDRPLDVWSRPLADDFSQDEVGELAHAFDLHLSRIRAFMERERAFTSDLSHELRTSLAVIFSTAEILLADDTLTEKQKSRVSRLERAAHEMAEMGTALLLIAREHHFSGLGSGTCVAEVIEEAVEKHRFLLKTKPIRIVQQTDPALVIAADRGLVFIAIANLIRNAFSYTEQGEISIHQDGESLTIHDSGCGIPAQLSDNLFLPHYHPSPQTKGSGIGLSLVKRICDHCGWTIQFASQKACGTTVKIQFNGHPSYDQKQRDTISSHGL